MAATTVLVGLALLSTLAMVPPGAGPRHAAADLVAADGHREVSTLTSGDTAVLTVETARQPGGAALQGGPEDFLGVFEAIGDEALQTSWVRETQQRRRGQDQGSVETLRSIDAEGLRAWVEVTEESTRSYDPPALVLPADVESGSRWSSSGTLGDPDEPEQPPGRYVLDASARSNAASGDGCLDVTSSLRVTDQDVQDSVRTWCPGRGVVAQQLPGEAWTRTDRPVAELLPDLPVETAQQPASWSPGSWTLQPFPVVRAGAPAPVVVPRPPSLLADEPLLSPTAGGDLVALGEVDGALQREWSAHPGGVVTAQAGFGDLTVVATTLRELVAYDATGLPRWTLALGEVVTRPLLALDESTVAAVDQSGEVRAVDLATGAVRWQQALSGDVAAAPARCGDVVVVADAQQRLTALAADSGERRWSVQMAEDVDLLSCDAGTVLVWDSQYDLHALEAADGSDRWSVARADLVHQMVLTPELVVLRSGDRVSTLALADGSPGWSLDQPVHTLLGSEEHLVVVGPDRLDVLDPTGVVEVSLPDPPAPGAGQVWVSPGTRGLWLIGTDGVPTWAGP